MAENSKLMFSIALVDTSLSQSPPSVISTFTLRSPPSGRNDRVSGSRDIDSPADICVTVTVTGSAVG